MKYTLSFTEELYEAVRAHLFDRDDDERAGYLYCGVGQTDAEARLLAQSWEPVASEHIDWSSPHGMQIDATSYRRALKKAARLKQSFVFVHSHPQGYESHSPQDDREEQELFNSAYVRIGGGPHASIVLTRSGSITGRAWLGDGSKANLSMIRVIGGQFRIVGTQGDALPEFFDRQIRAFGEDVQRLLAALTVGVVGAGGTGSAVFEQLVRLGVGRILVADGDRFAMTNVNRVYGSSVNDDELKKVLIARRNAGHIGLSTTVEVRPDSILHEDILNGFRECDIIFSCVDREFPRALLNTLALYYLIPILDLGVEVDSEEGRILSITGRVSTVYPGVGCLYCRRAITSDVIAAEAVAWNNPEEYSRLAALGYTPELGRDDPAVIPFTSAVAAAAISELLHRLTLFGGSDRKSSEVRIYFHDTRMRTMAPLSRPGCYCSDRSQWGIGDRKPFLDVVWTGAGR